MKRRELLLFLSGFSLWTGPFRSVAARLSGFHKDDPERPAKEPYVLCLPEGGPQLVYYGVVHTNDVRDSQISDIERRWNDLKPELALTEWNMWPVTKSAEEAVTEFGEQGFVRHLAERDGVAIDRIDPTRAEQLRYLLKFHQASRIKVYYLLLYATLRRTRKNTLINDSEANDLLRGLTASHSFYRGAPRNVAEAEEIIRRHYPDLADWRRCPASVFHPTAPRSFAADIHVTLNDYRDRMMLRTLTRALKKGKRIFAVVGRSHVVAQEKALRQGLRASG